MRNEILFLADHSVVHKKILHMRKSTIQEFNNVIVNLFELSSLPLKEPGVLSFWHRFFFINEKLYFGFSGQKTIETTLKWDFIEYGSDGAQNKHF